MQYSRLGKSDLSVSKIGFGCMSLKGSSAASGGLINRALELGINYFDTADLYDKGENEKLVGTWLKPQRHEVVLATKVGNQWKADGSGWDWNPRKAYILAAAEQSLKRLQTDYIDLYQLHGGTIDDPIDETIEAFELLKEQGKIRQYGISSIRPNVIREYVKKSKMVSVMMQYSLLDRRPEEECLALLKANGISVLSRGSIAQGLLIDKPAKAYLGWSAAAVAHTASLLKEIAAGKNGNVTQTAVSFVLQHEPLSSAVIGIRTLEQLEDITAGAALPVWSEEEMELLTAAAAPQYYAEHR